MRKEQFETWMRNNMPGLSLTGYRSLGDTWTYRSPVTQSYWAVWQAALRSDRGF